MKSLFAALLLVGTAFLPVSALEPVGLRTELQTAPTQVGTAPRLSWQLASDGRGKLQTGYHLLAASSLEKLDDKSADLWNSGKKVFGGNSFLPWNGKSLKGVGKVFWKVRVWDEEKKPGPWSQPATFQVDGEATLSPPRRISTFESSSSALNALHAESLALLEKRLTAFAKGEPEALGAGDQVHRSAREMLYHFEAIPHLTRWLRLMDANRTKEGAFRTGPTSTQVASVASDAAIIVHHPVWWMSGDAAYPKERWKLYEDHMIFRETKDRKFHGTAWGEVKGTEGMTAEFLDLCYLGFTNRLIRELAVPAQQPLNAIRFQDYAARIRKGFQLRFWQPGSSLAQKSQSAQVLALRSAVLKPEQQQTVIDKLTASLAKDGLQVGPIGAHFLPGVLSLTGNQETAVKILAKLDDEQKKAFLGNGIAEWFMAYLAGIDAVIPGFQQVRIAPRIPKDDSVKWIKAAYESPKGKVSVHWQKRKDGGLQVDFTIPAGMLGRLELPAPKDAKILEGGKPLSEIPFLEVAKRGDDQVDLISGSGSYSLVIQ